MYHYIYLKQAEGLEMPKQACSYNPLQNKKSGTAKSNFQILIYILVFIF